jgi:hypothetical protein
MPARQIAYDRKHLLRPLRPAESMQGLSGFPRTIQDSVSETIAVEKGFFVAVLLF